MAEYAGESIAKKVARIRLYRRTRKMLKSYGHDMKNLKALVLAGPEATEVGCLRHILEIKPENVVAIDRDEAACKNFSKKMPNSVVINGDLADPKVNYTVMMLFNTGGCHFIHLDLMGLATFDTKKLYAIYGQLAVDGSIAAITFLRGRETGYLKSELELHKEVFEKMRIPGKWARTIDKLCGADPGRSRLHAASLAVYAHEFWYYRKQKSEGIENPSSFIKEASNDPLLAINQDMFFTPIASYAYTGEVSPMGVVVSQLVSREERANEHGLWWKELSNLSRDASCIIKKDSMKELLAEADSLEKTFTNHQVAEILDVSTGTLAAWRAHRTMGTYA